MLDKLKHTEAEIIDQFLADDGNRPWIIGFSGGKDSTMMLQLVWYALRKLDPILRRQRRLYLICNDTLVENPRISDFIGRTLRHIERAAVAEGFDIIIEQTQPRLEDTFWVNLLGKGYPAPNNIFRWCTERLKINPTTRRILEKIDDNGEVILLLGTRSAESANRARSINKHRFGDSRLRKHILPQAFVFTPIKDFSTEEVWQYLTAVPSPWSGRNTELITLYRNANGGDCPLVIDTSTPSCGQSRFGCWVCTVVKKDASMEALIDNGEEWMLPLLELRDLLAESRDRIDWREPRRRNGANSPGPYKPEIRAMLLERLLQAQYAVQLKEPDTELISHQELVAIQVMWYRDGVFHHQVADLYNRIYNSSIMKADKMEAQQKKEQEILSTVCTKTPDHVSLIGDLLQVQKTKILMRRKAGLSDDMEAQLERFLKNKKTPNRLVHAD